MADRWVTLTSSGVARPVAELPWLRRKVSVRLARLMLRKMPVEGLLGVDRDGNPIWAEGYPEALQRRTRDDRE